MDSNENIIRGKAYVLGDNIDTDQIIPAQYLNLVPTIPEEYRKLGSYALAGLPESFPDFVEDGEERTAFTVIIAGRNFGCGSSREHAPVCLGAAGTQAVVAESYARIYFRNSIATGEVYPLECEERLCDIFKTGDDVEVNLEENSITRVDTGKTYTLKTLGAVGPVIEAGGIFGYARATGMIDQVPDEQPDENEANENEWNDEPEETVVGTRYEEAERITPFEKNVTPEDLASLKTRIIAVANQKGGVGKTTTVVNLSSYLSTHNKKILVIDLDPQANATSGLGLPKQTGTSLYRALLGEGNAADLIQKTAVKGVDIIPSELDLAGSEVDVARVEGYLHCFSNIMVPLLRDSKYHFVIIDCPPSLGILTMNALTAAHSMIVPIQCEYYALEGLSVTNHIIQQMHESGANPNLKIEGILMTMYDRRTRLSTDVIKEVRKHFGKKVYKTLIPRNVRLSEAPSYGQPILTYDKRSAGAKAYKRLANELLERRRYPSRFKDAPKKKKSLKSKLLHRGKKKR